MKTTVTGRVNNYTVRQNQIEYLHSAIEGCSLYSSFDQIENHIGMMDKRAIPHNAMLVYVDVSNIVPKVTDKIGLPFSHDSEVFYDWIDDSLVSDDDKFEMEFIEIVDKNGRRFGLYNKERNLLLLSDVTHNEVCYDLFCRLWPVLKMGLEAQKVTFKGLKKREFQVTVGADPEAEIVSDGQVVRANEYMQRSNHSVDPNCEIGMDGSGCPAEFRPKPADDADKLTGNMMSIFRQWANLYPSLGLCGKGDRYAIGCHIHFGIKSLSANQFIQFNPQRDLLNTLDMFLAKPMWHMNGQARGGYASFSAYENKRYGFEYRSMPGGILSHPEMFDLCVKIGQKIVDKYVNSEPITYEQNGATEEDYLALGLSKDEYVKFLNFRSQWGNMSKDILQNWLQKSAAPIAPTRAPADIVMTDEWSPEISRRFRERLDSFTRTMGGGLRLRFFGYAAKRGFFGDLEIEGMVAAHNEPAYDSGANVLSIGLPWNVRNDAAAYEQHEAELVAAVEYEIARIKARIEGHDVPERGIRGAEITMNRVAGSGTARRQRAAPDLFREIEAQLIRDHEAESTSA